MNCRVCNSQLNVDYEVCRYCGYDNVYPLTSDLPKQEAHRESLLSKLTDFSITAINCKPSAKAIDTKSVTQLLFSKDTTGLDISKAMKKSKIWIAQYEEDKKVTLEINYKFAGSPRKVKAVLTPTHGEVWHVGLQIDEHLQLVAYLGETASKSVPLKLS